MADLYDEIEKFIPEEELDAAFSAILGLDAPYEPSPYPDSGWTFNHLHDEKAVTIQKYWRGHITRKQNRVVISANTSLNDELTVEDLDMFIDIVANKCEHCNNTITSGRFCTTSCARKFAVNHRWKPEKTIKKSSNKENATPTTRKVRKCKVCKTPGHDTRNCPINTQTPPGKVLVDITEYQNMVNTITYYNTVSQMYAPSQ